VPPLNPRAHSPSLRSEMEDEMRKEAAGDEEEKRKK
jgi:hypothetical protein